MTQPSVTELKVPNPSAPWSAVRIYRIPGHHQRSTGPVTEVCHDYHITWSSGGRPGENTTVGPPTLTARLRFSGNAQWGSERRELAALGLCMRILCFCINEKKKKIGGAQERVDVVYWKRGTFLGRGAHFICLFDWFFVILSGILYSSFSISSRLDHYRSNVY